MFRSLFNHSKKNTPGSSEKWLIVAWARTSPRPSPWQGEGGLLGARMAGMKTSRFIRSTRNWFPLLGKERARVRFQPMPKSIELKCLGYCKKQLFRCVTPIILSIFTILCIIFTHSPTIAATPLQIQAKQHYDRHEFTTAVQLWQQALGSATKPAQQIAIHQALSLTFQDLGQWQQAQGQLSKIQALLDQNPNPFLQAKTLNIQATLSQNLGKYQEAIATWKQSEHLYRQTQDPYGTTLSQLNQAQALQILGQHQQAKLLLERINPPKDSALEVMLNLRLGITLQAQGEFAQAKVKLEAAQTIALAQNLSDLQAQLLSELANFDERNGQFQTALDRHHRAFTLARSPQIQVKCLIHQFPLLIKTQQTPIARHLLADLQQVLAKAPNSRWAIDAAINIAEQALNRELDSPSAIEQIKQLLDRAADQAEQLGDPLATIAVQGMIGHFYEHQNNLDLALKYTRLAVRQGESLEAYPETSLPWHWQEGRLLSAQGKPEAIAAYDEAVSDLARLRQDLATTDQAVQFSFRDQVEPIYKEYVQLLLTNINVLSPEIRQQRLIKARETIGALQLTELQDFLKEACNSYKPHSIEKIPPQTALIYPIVLNNRLEVITALPDQPLFHHGIDLAPNSVTTIVNQLRSSLNPEIAPETGLPAAQKLYDWMIRPLEPQIKDIETLIFVPNGFLRNIPLGVLHDGDRYLIERYNLALTTGLQLTNSSNNRKDIQPTLLLAGLSQARQGFAALSFVEQELQTIAAQLPSTVLLNQNFSPANLQSSLADRSPSVVHLATHGQFSSNSDQTFLLTWNDRLNLNQIRQWLQQASRNKPLDLLVLSACQTAKGDDRAELGLAGMAVKSGAASTLATLWNVSDQATAQLMTDFYQYWRSPKPQTKAQALRQAQLKQLRSNNHRHPYYWAGVVLIGDWN
jgi:CHAT domain-containing protein